MQDIDGVLRWVRTDAVLPPHPKNLLAGQKDFSQEMLHWSSWDKSVGDLILQLKLNLCNVSCDLFLKARWCLQRAQEKGSWRINSDLGKGALSEYLGKSARARWASVLVSATAFCCLVGSCLSSHLFNRHLPRTYQCWKLYSVHMKDSYLNHQGAYSLAEGSDR